jgi:hypothetical protein
MNIETATAFIDSNKGEAIVVRLTDGMTAFGEAFSVNSKGVNIKVDGKTKSVSLGRIDGLELDNLGEDDGDEDMTDEDIYAELGDGMTTAELAAHLSDALKTDLTPKELRVHLRALGLGVGKGRKYSLSATEYRMVRDLINA